MLSVLREKRLLWPSVMTLVALGILLSLGTWQWQRRAWKNELVQTIEARSTATALPPEAWPNLRCQTVQDVGLEFSCDYMRVTLRGTWDHARERHVFIAVPRQPNGIGGPGYWVFTPLVMAYPDGAREIFVNRGFVPEAHKVSTGRAAGQLADVVEVTGLFRSAEPRSWFTGRNDEPRNIWYARNPFEFLAKDLGKQPAPAVPQSVGGTGPSRLGFYVDQTGEPPPGGLPLPLAGRIAIPNRHLEYALTWWALAATLAGVFAVYTRGRLRGR